MPTDSTVKGRKETETERMCLLEGKKADENKMKLMEHTGRMGEKH